MSEQQMTVKIRPQRYKELNKIPVDTLDWPRSNPFSGLPCDFTMQYPLY